MAGRMQENCTVSIEQDAEPFPNNEGVMDFDDDGRPKRTGTWLTASSHIITAVIGSGVLSLSWALAQLGWIAGIVILVGFSVITAFSSNLLADFYRYPDPVTGRRNRTYREVVQSYLGGGKTKLCGAAQYSNLVGVGVGYTITASISLVAIQRSNCFHKNGHHAECKVSNYPYMIIFGCIEIILSQVKNFHKLSWLSIIAAIMSFAYSSIGIGLAIAKVAGGVDVRTSLSGTKIGVDVSAADKVFRAFQAIGNIAFAYSYSMVLVEVQDTLKSSPPENREMKKASFVGISVTSLFYILCGSMGYAAFGNNAPGNLLTGFGFYEPFWLIDFANACIVVHLLGAYQVFSQPVFDAIENWCKKRWPDNKLIGEEHTINLPITGVYYYNTFRLAWRTVYVVATTLVAMIFPFFNDILGFIGAFSYWPLSIYLPIEMHIAHKRLPRASISWILLEILIASTLIVAIIAGVGSIQGLVIDVRKYKPFKS